MMWLYGVDEKPMGIASCDKKSGLLEFAVAKIGPTTNAFHKLKKGDLLGIRGPFGKGFTLSGKSIAVIGGGTGIAPTKYFTEFALSKGVKTTLFHGARTKNELAFRECFEELEKKNNVQAQMMEPTDFVDLLLNAVKILKAKKSSINIILVVQN